MDYFIYLDLRINYKLIYEKRYAGYFFIDIEKIVYCCIMLSFELKVVFVCKSLIFQKQFFLIKTNNIKSVSILRFSKQGGFLSYYS